MDEREPEDQRDESGQELGAEIEPSTPSSSRDQAAPKVGDTPAPEAGPEAEPTPADEPSVAAGSAASEEPTPAEESPEATDSGAPEQSTPAEGASATMGPDAAEESMPTEGASAATAPDAPAESTAASDGLADTVSAEPEAKSGTEDGGESGAESEAAPESPEAAWYVVHCYSGYENKVRHNLEQRIETMGMKDKIFDVVIPTQEEIEVRDGKRRTVERHIFPGYVLVNMALSEESWYVVRNTPGVTGFVGMGNLPTALRPEEVAQIIKRMEAEAPTVKVSYKLGERVRIIDGPFNDFRGTVSDIDMERTKVRVMVSFFGRETPVELDFLQVEKA